MGTASSLLFVRDIAGLRVRVESTEDAFCDLLGSTGGAGGGGNQLPQALVTFREGPIGTPPSDVHRPFELTGDARWPWLARSRFWSCAFDPSSRRYAYTLPDPSFLRDRATVVGTLLLPVLTHVRAQGGLVLHAASYREPGGAWIAAGRSGAGKTTLVRSLPVDARLGDELALLVPRGSTWWALPSPFRGREGLASAATAEARLEGLLFLDTEIEGEIRPLTPATALPLLLEHMVPLRTPWMTDNPLAAPSRLAEAIPSWRGRPRRDRHPRDSMARRA